MVDLPDVGYQLRIVVVLVAVFTAPCPAQGSVAEVLVDASMVQSLWLPPHKNECPILNSSNDSGRCHCSQFLDIRCTQLEQLPQFLPDDKIYSGIYLAEQRLTSLPPAAFAGLKVRKIVLNSNAIEDRLSAGSLSGLERVLHELQLAECQLPTLPDGMLNDMTELRHLHLWNNRLSAIPSNFFKHCKNLTELLLWGNRIERIDQHTFAGLWALRRLDLDRNRISALSKNAFKHLRNLEVIHLGENRIREISSETFQFVPNLKVLSLDGNGLQHIYAKAFHGLNGLLSLALQNNNISYLPAEGLFVNMTKLATLLLRNNRLETVWSNQFIGLRSLSRIDLGENRLSALPDGMLQRSGKLRHVSFDENQLKTIGKCALSSTKRQQQAMVSPYLRSLSLMGNPSLMCDCRLAWLVDFREKDGVTVYGTCSKSRFVTTPTSVANRSTYKALSCSFAPLDCKQ